MMHLLINVFYRCAHSSKNDAHLTRARTPAQPYTDNPSPEKHGISDLKGPSKHRSGHIANVLALPLRTGALLLASLSRPHALARSAPHTGVKSKSFKKKNSIIEPANCNYFIDLRVAAAHLQNQEKKLTSAETLEL